MEWMTCRSCGYWVCAHCVKKEKLRFCFTTRDGITKYHSAVTLQCRKCVRAELEEENWPDRYKKRESVYAPEDRHQYDRVDRIQGHILGRNRLDPVICRLCNQKQNHRFFTCYNTRCGEVVCRTCFSTQWLEFRESNPGWTDLWCPICMRRCLGCNDELKNTGGSSASCAECKRALCDICAIWWVGDNGSWWPG